MSIVKNHFDSIASNYDYWKNKNWYYYKNLKEIIKEFVPDRKEVLEIGCGTGDILASTNPSYGIGADVSVEIIRISKSIYSKYENLIFCMPDEIPNRTYDYILMVDLVEHLEDRKTIFNNLLRFCSSNTKIIIIMANPIWEPILLLLEKLNLKMPEGPHD